MKELLAVYRTELIKTKNSFAFWLVILGALFIPAFFVSTIAWHWEDYVHYLVIDNPNPWNEYSRKLFNGVHFTFLPLLIILIVALVFNIEHKSNTWKHVFAMPIAKTKIFFGKYLSLVTLVFLLYCLMFIFYLLGGYLLGIWKPQFDFLNYSPSYMYGTIHTNIVAYISKSFITVLAIFGIHFWLSFRIKNLFPTIGIGLGGVVLAIGMYISHWHSLIFFPYGLPVLMCNYAPGIDHFLTTFQQNSLIYFSVILMASYFDFIKFFRG